MIVPAIYILKPLSDCTNVVPIGILSSLNRSRKPSLCSKEADESYLKHDSSIGSNNTANPSIVSQPSTPPNRRSVAASGTIGRENSSIISAYSRKWNSEARKSKGKAIALEMWEKLNEQRGNAGKFEIDAASHPKSEKKQHFSLPQDFIDHQKAYFLEIDAVELPEEFASDSAE